MILIAILGLIITALGVLYAIKGYYKDSRKPKKALPGDKDLTIWLWLINFVWRYPDRGGNYVTWAVKESYVLRGWLKKAEEEPGLGVSIATTDFAKRVFSNKANPKIDGMIAWACANRMEEYPYFLQGKKVDQITGAVEEIIPDFRHTLAFAIIIERNGKLSSLVNEYLSYALKFQNKDGGWPAGKGKTISEVFTVLYATELLSLCCEDKSFNQEKLEEAKKSLKKATRWLIDKFEVEGLWTSGVLSDYPWDDLVTTAWVIRRLAPLENIRINGWVKCISNATESMIFKTSKPQTWNSSDQLQRFRVETRVSAAVSKTLESGLVNNEIAERLEIYLSNWRNKSLKFAVTISKEQWDVATAVLFLEAVHSDKELKKMFLELLSKDPLETLEIK